MIAKKLIDNEKGTLPWKKSFMVEQDMIISRALVSLYNNPTVSQNLIFRGGTALNKLYLKPASRYSEDIDLVLVKEQPVGFLMDAIKDSLEWIGKPKTKRDKWGFKVIYPFENVGGGKSKLKIETNSRENFNYLPLKEINFSTDSNWFSGSTTVMTYAMEELMGTKLRAVYQRRKGRDLFDAWHVFSKGLADIKKVVPIFHAYNEYNSVKITKKMFQKNMETKKNNEDFRRDIRDLLPVGTDYSFDKAYDFFMREVVPLI